MGQNLSLLLAVKPETAAVQGHGGIPVWIFIICIVIIAAAAYFVANYLAKSMNEKFVHEQQQDAENIILVSREKAQLIESDAKDNAINILKEAENEIQRRRGELTREDDRLQKKRIDLDHRVEKIEQRENNLNKRQSTLDKRQNDIERMSSKQLEELQRVSNMTVAEARQELLEKVEHEAHSDMARIIRQIEQEARLEGDKKAREVIATAIQRVASDQVNEITTSIVNLPGEEMKGRIVGRNGRNIRAFEQVKDYTQERYNLISKDEDMIDLMADRVSNYLVQLSGHISEERHTVIQDEYLTCLTEFERLGDHAVNMLEEAEQSNLSDEAVRELVILQDLIERILDVTMAAFTKCNIEDARHIEPLEEVVDDMVAQLKQNHLERLRRGTCSIVAG